MIHMVRMTNSDTRINISNIKRDEIGDVRKAVEDFAEKRKELHGTEHGVLCFDEEKMYDSVKDSEWELTFYLEPVLVNVAVLYRYIEKVVSNMDRIIILVHA